MRRMRHSKTFSASSAGAVARLAAAAAASLLAVCAYGAPAGRRPSGRTAKRDVPVIQAPAQPMPSGGAYRLVSKVPGGVSCDPYVGAISADAETGRILFTDRADKKGYPASVTKLMTALLVVEDIEAGRYGFDDRAEASQRAVSQQPSSVGIKLGQTMTIRDLCTSIMVKSANDAAVILAEYAGLHGAGAVKPPPGAKPGQSGEYEAFIARMTARAKELGMANTVYTSANGLPPEKNRAGKPQRDFDSSTAGDLLKLAREVIRHPQILEWTKLARTTVTDGSGKPLEISNHNLFLAGTRDTPKIEGCDGLKTGYTDAAGSSIVLTATRKGRRALVVVLSSSGRKLRDDNAGRLMNDALGALSGW